MSKKKTDQFIFILLRVLLGCLENMVINMADIELFIWSLMLI